MAKKKSSVEKRTLILWALLACENAGAFQNDLKPEPKKADRTALEGDGLIICEKRGPKKRIWLEVTDKGWEWAGGHLDAPLPTRSNAGSQVLQAWLTRVKAFMQARGLVLADILGPQPNEPAVNYPILRERIRSAYLEVTGGRLNARALLRDIRARLKDVDRAAVDAALQAMHLEEGTTLSGLDNPQEITPDVRDAALNFKGEPMFVLWIAR